MSWFKSVNAAITGNDKTAIIASVAIQESYVSSARVSAVDDKPLPASATAVNTAKDAE
jgi:hypothetical protein